MVFKCDMKLIAKPFNFLQTFCMWNKVVWGVEADSTITTFQAFGQKNIWPIPLVGNSGKKIKTIKITIKSTVVFLEWSTRRPLDIMTSGLVMISVGDI